MSRIIPDGLPLPLELILPDGVTTKYPRAHVYNDDTNVEVVGSPFTLTHASLGAYRNTAFTPGAIGRFRALYITYNDASHTVISPKYGRVTDIFEVGSPPGVVTPADLVPLAKIQYSNKLSTTFNNITGIQEVITWAEKDCIRISGTNCIITVKDSAGVVKWTATQVTPNPDGVFKFVNPITPLPDLDYYIVVSITVDGLPRVCQQPFITVG